MVDVLSSTIYNSAVGDPREFVSDMDLDMDSDMHLGIDLDPDMDLGADWMRRY